MADAKSPQQALQPLQGSARVWGTIALSAATFMATRTRIAMSASTIEIAYAPARSNAS